MLFCCKVRYQHLLSYLFIENVGDSDVDMCQTDCREFHLLPSLPASHFHSAFIDQMDYYRFIELSIKECRSNGIDCKIHGLSIVGRNRFVDATVHDVGDDAAA